METTGKRRGLIQASKQYVYRADAKAPIVGEDHDEDESMCLRVGKEKL